LPNGVNVFWDDSGLGRSDAINDRGFVTALIEEFAALGARYSTASAA